MVTKPFSEEIQVEIKSGCSSVTFDGVVLPTFDTEAIRLVMPNASQSAAPDRYSAITAQFLQETNIHARYLEENGRLDIGGNV